VSNGIYVPNSHKYDVVTPSPDFMWQDQNNLQATHCTTINVFTRMFYLK